MNWYFAAVRKYATFSGRARRREFWLFVLFYFLFGFAAIALDAALGTFSEEDGVGLISTVFVLSMVIPGFAVTVRRLHDIGRSGWWLLVWLVPLVGTLWLTILMLFNGQPGGNRFGPDPKATLAARPNYDYLP